jgi:monoamine oxidase
VPGEPQAWRCGGLVLAGEHCSRAKAWVEGAIASGQDAAAMVACPEQALAV